MPISSNGSKLTVNTFVGDKIHTNVDSVNPFYGINQQREAHQPPETDCMNAVFGRNIVKATDKPSKTAKVDDKSAQATDKSARGATKPAQAVDEALTAANKKDLRKRNLK